MPKGKSIITDQKLDKVLISSDDLEYLMAASNLLKQKSKDYDELWDKYSKLQQEKNRVHDELNKQVNREELEKENWCEDCDQKFSCKSAYNVHVQCNKHLKNVNMNKIIKGINHQKQMNDIELSSDDEEHETYDLVFPTTLKNLLLNCKEPTTHECEPNCNECQRSRHIYNIYK